MNSFDVTAARAYNTFKDQVSMSGPSLHKSSILEPIKDNAPSDNKPKLLNPYKQKPYYVDNRHTFVPERDVRVGYHGYIPPPYPPYQTKFPNPSAARPFRPSLIVEGPRDKSLGTLGGADIDFGTEKPEETKKEDAK